MQGLAGAQVEAGMMPRATDGIVNQNPLAERAIVMGALSVDGEEFGTPADEEDGLPIGMTDDLAAVGKIVEGDALSQVRSA